MVSFALKGQVNSAQWQRPGYKNSTPHTAPLNGKSRKGWLTCLCLLLSYILFLKSLRTLMTLKPYSSDDCLRGSGKLKRPLHSLTERPLDMLTSLVAPFLKASPEWVHISEWYTLPVCRKYTPAQAGLKTIVLNSSTL